ncbi:MAG: inorganic phosphate transporter, partial [Saprospiraceae bacterium]|nr:inorganic phosphate transporter [Saprospiraceae bacterium]
MASFYLILIIILFILAISDLIVGVSNDAVNFLNSAVGARAATLQTIILFFFFGVLIGATFSSGMMEVARKGIFHPEYFYFSEIMILFMAVMVTDVILLDAFNTFGMPTSTTVSIVFELLGAAVAISLVKILNDPNALQLYEYINSAKALAIISGILVSVVIAFTTGVFTQYISRLFFSFDYEERMRKYGAIWGGLGIMGIFYFMLIKGAKGAAFLSDDFVNSLTENTTILLLTCFIGGSIILYLLNRIFKIDILQVLVLFGTFALAMAFAGNDLVNFIGVPLAGYNSYQLYLDSGSMPDGLLMNGLAGQVPTPIILLLLAGLVMVITLYTSKKAQSVLRTSVDLGRQDEGYERFGSFMLSRTIVRRFATLAGFINDRLPKKWQQLVDRQFDQTAFTRKQVHLGKDAPAFDMIRASVTLVVASSLIAIGTNLKLPLSTTYVTFIVFMGTSLADGACGRESAVYRVSGVLTVIGGWFFTALSAFIVAFTFAMIFQYGGFIAMAILLVVAGFLMMRTHRMHGQKLEEEQALEKTVDEGTLSKAKVINLCVTQLKSFLKQYGDLLDKSFVALGEENLSALNKIFQAFKPVQDKILSL